MREDRAGGTVLREGVGVGDLERVVGRGVEHAIRQVGGGRRAEHRADRTGIVARAARQRDGLGLAGIRVRDRDLHGATRQVRVRNGERERVETDSSTGDRHRAIRAAGHLVDGRDLLRRSIGRQRVIVLDAQVIAGSDVQRVVGVGTVRQRAELRWQGSREHARTGRRFRQADRFEAPGAQVAHDDPVQRAEPLQVRIGYRQRKGRADRVPDDRYAPRDAARNRIGRRDRRRAARTRGVIVVDAEIVSVRGSEQAVRGVRCRSVGRCDGAIEDSGRAKALGKRHDLVLAGVHVEQRRRDRAEARTVAIGHREGNRLVDRHRIDGNEALGAALDRIRVADRLVHQPVRAKAIDVGDLENIG